MPPMSDTADSGVLKLPAHSPTTVAADLHASFHPGIEIDAGEVESIGQAMLQLIVAAHAEGATIVHPSPAFVDRISACGLAGAVGLTIAEEAAQ
jgi:hypothetical protein